MKFDIFKKLKQARRKLKSWYQVALPGGVVIGLVVLVRLSGALQPLEWGAYDRFLRWRSSEPPDNRIVIIGINEDDIRAVGYPVPDGELAQLITKLHSYKPRAIAIDIFRDQPAGTGKAELSQVFKTFKNVIGIEKSILPDAQNSTVDPPPDLPPEQVGFADVIFDADGNVRRNLISSPTLKGGYQFSLGFRLAELYLKAEGIESSNGIADPAAIRFGEVELTRFQTHSGGYIHADAGGNQILLNWRNGNPKFLTTTLQDVKSGKFNLDAVRDRLVIVGMTAASVKDTVTAPAVADDFIEGVEYQAQATSQIISTVLDQRPFIHTWTDGWEYLWIVFWGGMGIVIGQMWTYTSTSQTPKRGSAVMTFLILTVISVGLVGTSYVLLMFSWWIPVVPTFIALLGTGLVTSYIQDLRSLITQRQQMIDQRQRTLDEAFNALHNGPLQTLAGILSNLKQEAIAPEQLSLKLESLDQELREVYESLRPDRIAQQVSAPLHELFYEIYHHTLQRDFPTFKQIKVKIHDFQPMDDDYLSLEQKRELCLFLEEALCNVGKHANGATRLIVNCKQEQGQFALRVIDNGEGIKASLGQSLLQRGGTKQARNLAKQLGGNFKRSPNTPKGTICELTWTLKDT